MIYKAGSDIRARNNTEAALAEGALHRIVFEQLREGIVVFGHDGKVREVNRAFAEMLGHSCEELLQSYVWDWDVKFSREQLLEMMRARDTLPPLFETVHKRKDGTLIDVEVAACMAEVNGEILHFGVHRNITARKRSQEAMVFLRTAIDLLPDLVYGKDTQGRFTLANASVAHLMGVPTPNDLVGRSDFEFYPKELASQYFTDEQQIIQTGRPLIAREEPCVDPAGNPIWLSTTKVPVRDAAGNITGLIGVGRDISERKQAEQALRDSAKKYRVLIETTSTGYVVIDADGRVADANAEYVRLTGRKELDEILGRRVTEWTARSDVARNADAVRRCVEEGLIRDLEIEYTDEQGKRTPVEVNATVLPTEREPQILGFVRDITRRKRAEEARNRAEESVAANEARFRSMVEDSWEVIFLIDGEGGVRYMSSAVSRVLGYSEEEVLGQSVFRRMHARDVSAARQLLAKSLATPNLPVVGECKYRRKDRVWRWFEYTIRNMLDNPAVGALVVISRDCTERIEREAELQRALKAAEAATRAKSEFLANMSHEIRTPMNGILGMTDLALSAEITPEQREYLETIKSSADSLLAVINDILDFSKIEAGKLDLERVEFDLVKTLGPALKALALQAGRKGLELNFLVEAEVPASVVTDPGRLRQVLVNLVGNAIKFTERGEVNVGVLSEAGEDGTDWLRFSVQDTGIGISPEKQRAIFDSFAQADSSVTRRYGGTGLGLTIARRLVEIMGGRLWLKSAPGEGSTFYFTVPVRVGETQRQAEPDVDLEGLSVLVVDDNGTNRRILEKILLAWSMRPVLAEDARTALRELEREPATGQTFRLVLVDASMPEMDGFALIEGIRQDPRLAELTIIVLTSAGHPGEIARGRELGIAAYLIKPIGPAELREAMLRALGTKRTGAAASESRPAAQPARRPLRILLAEDNAVNQKVVCRLLENQGHQVQIAENGSQALDCLSRGSFDVILMDVQMPEMDGLEATARIRSRERNTGRHVPIIALTAHALKTDHDRCLAAGMDGYLSKPIRPDELFRQIEHLCGGQALVPEEKFSGTR